MGNSQTAKYSGVRTQGFFIDTLCKGGSSSSLPQGLSDTPRLGGTPESPAPRRLGNGWIGTDWQLLEDKPAVQKQPKLGQTEASASPNASPAFWH